MCDAAICLAIPVFRMLARVAPSGGDLYGMALYESVEIGSESHRLFNLTVVY